MQTPESPAREPLGGPEGLENDLETVIANAAAWQCEARLEAVHALARVAPSLFSARSLDVIARYSAWMAARGADGGTREPSGTRSADGSTCDDDFSCPPPRAASLFPVPKGTRSTTAWAFVAGTLETAWGASLAHALALEPAHARSFLARMDIVVHPAFDRAACYVGPLRVDGALHDQPADLSEVVLFTNAGHTSDVRTQSLWVHEIAHALHGLALNQRGTDAYFVDDVRKETVALAAELLFLCDSSWEMLAQRTAERDPRALGATAYWWRESLHAGGAYIPAAWRVWNALRAARTFSSFLT